MDLKSTDLAPDGFTFLLRNSYHGLRFHDVFIHNPHGPPFRARSRFLRVVFCIECFTIVPLITLLALEVIILTATTLLDCHNMVMAHTYGARTVLKL